MSQIDFVIKQQMSDDTNLIEIVHNVKCKHSDFQFYYSVIINSEISNKYIPTIQYPIHSYKYNTHSNNAIHELLIYMKKL